ncbi:MAG: twin-arginine translocase subunit TatC [Candidatus Makaraimicrobium thalassicum]|nr:MAG: twin-arginine translocase subunit TatC [Candidatus Omnitrophota bacterium]
MSPFYLEETKKLDVVSHLEELRRRILFCLLALVAAAIISFAQGDLIMALVKRPILGLVDELIFISPTEAFVACIKVAFLAAFVICFPVILYHGWAFLFPALPRDMRSRVVLWLIFALILFFGGIMFSYFLAIPAALDFLIGFSKGIALARISLGKYISFFGALVLIGGIVFEIPIVIGLLTDAGLLEVRTLKRKRHYAILAIMIFAAVITPTQDILNMLLFAMPMIVLYEIGILIAVLIERHKKKK